jgi:hypothetical protein
MCCPVRRWASKQISFRMDSKNQKKLFSRHEELIDVVFPADEIEGDATLAKRKADYLKIFAMHIEIFEDLRQPHDFAEDEIIALQRKIDEFGRLIVSTCSGKDITNYIHISIAGHIRFFLRRFGNLYRHSNNNLEGCVKATRTYAQRGTQHGGFSGQGAKLNTNVVRNHKRHRMTKAMSDHFVSRLAFAMSKFDDDPTQYMRILHDKGKAIFDKQYV